MYRDKNPDGPEIKLTAEVIEAGAAALADSEADYTLALAAGRMDAIVSAMIEADRLRRQRER